MNYLFSADTYRIRRNSLMEKVSDGLLLFLSNGESPMNYTDNTYRYRQDSNFLYFFGLDMPNVIGLIDVESKKSILFGNDASIEDIVWTGPVEKLASLGEKIGVDEIKPLEELKEVLNNQKVHYLPPYRMENNYRISKLIDISIDDVSNNMSYDLVDAVISLRAVKSSEEIVQMEEALAVTKSMHVKAMSSVQAGMKEAALAGIARGIAVGNEGDLAYPIILSKDGQTLHNHDQHNVLEEGQIVLADMGSENRMHYAADITRTFPVSKTFTDDQKKIYQIVLDAEMTSIEMCKPGVTYAAVHHHAATVIATGLKEMGLMKGDVEAAVTAGAHALFFPHGLGHMIGLDVHDMEDLGEDRVGYSEEVKRSDLFGTAYLRLGRKLETGFVLTVEPGIYFIPELIDQWSTEGKFKDYINYDALDKWRSFGGIRIEDNVLITENGRRVLGPAIPKTIAEIEAVRASS